MAEIMINLTNLRNWNYPEDMIRWIENNCEDRSAKAVIQKLTCERFDWQLMALTSVLSWREQMEIAIFSANMAIPIWENELPKNKVPRMIIGGLRDSLDLIKRGFYPVDPDAKIMRLTDSLVQVLRIFMRNHFRALMDSGDCRLQDIARYMGRVWINEMVVCELSEDAGYSDDEMLDRFKHLDLHESACIDTARIRAILYTGFSCISAAMLLIIMKSFYCTRAMINGALAVLFAFPDDNRAAGRRAQEEIIGFGCQLIKTMGGD